MYLTQYKIKKTRFQLRTYVRTCVHKHLSYFTFVVPNFTFKEVTYTPNSLSDKRIATCPRRTIPERQIQTPRTSTRQIRKESTYVSKASLTRVTYVHLDIIDRVSVTENMCMGVSAVAFVRGGVVARSCSRICSRVRTSADTAKQSSGTCEVCVCVRRRGSLEMCGNARRPPDSRSPDSRPPDSRPPGKYVRTCVRTYVVTSQFPHSCARSFIAVCPAVVHHPSCGEFTIAP